MSAQERIVIDPQVLVGVPIIAGIRLSVEFIVGLLALGWTEEDILLAHNALRFLHPRSRRALLADPIVRWVL